MINNIVKLEYNIEFQISFGVKNPTSHKQQLIENAIADANKNASIIAKSAELKLK